MTHIIPEIKEKSAQNTNVKNSQLEIKENSAQDINVQKNQPEMKKKQWAER